MKIDGVDRRVAAWLLTLPGPWRANSKDEAVREARRHFDPKLSERQFEEALRRVGYVILKRGQSSFAVVPERWIVPEREGRFAHVGRPGAARVLDGVGQGSPESPPAKR